MILNILLWGAALYLLIGAITTYVALYAMMRVNDPDIIRSREAWLNYSPRQKFKGVCVGVVVWLPAALGLKRKTFFK